VSADVIKLKCACGITLSVKPEYAGRRLRCPVCKEPVTVSKSGKVSRKSSAPRSQKSTKQRRAKQISEKKSVAPPADDWNDIEELEELKDVERYGDDLDDYGADDYQLTAPPPRRTKKNKKKKSKAKDEKTTTKDSDETSSKLMYALYGVAGTVSAVIAFFIVSGIFSADFSNAAAHALPEDFETAQHEQVRLTWEYPTDKGWEMKSGGGTGGRPPWVVQENEAQGVRIEIRASVSGTAIGDIAGANNPELENLPDELRDQLDPIIAVHDFQREMMTAKYETYEETDPVKIETGYGNGRISDYEAGSTFSTVYGVRATLITNQYQYNVICRVPKKRLEEYRPVFERIIQSIGR